MIMNPYHHIGNLDREITAMQKELRFSKNRGKDLKRINVLISSRNAFESMLKNKYYTEVVELLFVYKALAIKMVYGYYICSFALIVLG